MDSVMKGLMGQCPQNFWAWTAPETEIVWCLNWRCWRIVPGGIRAPDYKNQKTIHCAWRQLILTKCLTQQRQHGCRRARRWTRQHSSQWSVRSAYKSSTAAVRWRHVLSWEHAAAAIYCRCGYGDWQITGCARTCSTTGIVCLWGVTETICEIQNLEHLHMLCIRICICICIYVSIHWGSQILRGPLRCAVHNI